MSKTFSFSQYKGGVEILQGGAQRFPYKTNCKQIITVGFFGGFSLRFGGT